MCRNEAITEDELKLITKTYQQVLHIKTKDTSNRSTRTSADNSMLIRGTSGQI